MNPIEYKKLRESIGSLSQVAKMLGVEEYELLKREVGSSSYPLTREASCALGYLAQNQRITARLLLEVLIRDIMRHENALGCSLTNEILIETLNHKPEFKTKILQYMTLLEVYEVISLTTQLEDYSENHEKEHCYSLG